MARSKVASRSYHDIAHLHPLTNVPTKYQLPTLYSFRDIVRIRFYRSRSLNKAKSQIKVTPLYCTPAPPNQCPYQVSTSYTLFFPRYSPDKIFKLKVSAVRSNQGQTMTLHTYTPNQCPYQVSTSYTLRFLKYSPDKLFPAARPHIHPDTMGENNTPTALKGCGVTTHLAVLKVTFTGGCNF